MVGRNTDTIWGKVTVKTSRGEVNAEDKYAYLFHGSDYLYSWRPHFTPRKME